MKFFEKQAVSSNLLSKAISGRLKKVKGMGAIEKTQKQLQRMSRSELKRAGIPKEEWNFASNATPKTKLLNSALWGAATKWNKTYNKAKKYL